MKILVYTTLFPNAEQPHHGIFVEKRLHELRKRFNFDVQVVAPVPWFPFASAHFRTYGKYAQIPKTERRSNITVHHPRYLVIPIIGWRIAPLFQLIATFITIYRLKTSSFSFDMIDSHFVFPDGVAAQGLGTLLNVPVSLTARGSDINDSPRYLLPRLFTKWAVCRARVVIAVSNELQRGIAALGRDLDTIAVLPNGVDASVFYPRHESGIRSNLGIDGKLVLSVGSLRKLKGHDILIEAIARLENVQLIIIGVGEERENLERLAERLGVTSRVHFVGAVANSDLAEYYCAADVFALASSHEGCPNVILEALACGTPIVATAVGAIPDMVPQVAQSYLVPARTVDAFVEKLKQCCDNPPDQALLVARAQELNWDDTCAKLFNLFELATSYA